MVFRYHEGNELSDSENYEINLEEDKTSILNVLSADRSDIGEYKCTVSTEIGSAESAPVLIEVMCKL